MTCSVSVGHFNRFFCYLLVYLLAYTLTLTANAELDTHCRTAVSVDSLAVVAASVRQCRVLYQQRKSLNHVSASNKVVKYARLSSQGDFVPIAAESHGPINRNALQFLSELGRWRLAETTGDVRASSFVLTDFRCGATI